MKKGDKVRTKYTSAMVSKGVAGVVQDIKIDDMFPNMVLIDFGSCVCWVFARDIEFLKDEVSE
ncbi:hypothetical protein [Listeria booriae]|uniref:hypothetical protein n=1 Tax=Listeria booriae TaxID=1552123 RepID=UPI001625E834|nr:hypothetical protein [Listeria booriae]MBC1982805.1 hypothetical protein [Listeria booriae]